MFQKLNYYYVLIKRVGDSQNFAANLWKKMPTTDTPSDQLAALVLVEGDEGHEERLDLRDVHSRVLREDLGGGEWMTNWIFPQTSRGSFSAVSTPIFASK